jgi:hypothetical protein
MNTDYFSSLLKLIMTWFSSGPVGIISGILGGLGILIFLRKIQQKIADAKFQGTLNDVSQTAGTVSKDASSDMEANDRLIKAILDSKPLDVPTPSKKPEPTPPVLEEPYIEVPANGKSRVAFDVITKNVPEGTPIMVERKWNVGKVSSSGTTRVMLVSPGNRSIDVKVNETWYSCPIIIEE